MSQENLDLVRSICASWERGDYSAVEWADPDIEFVTTDGPSPGSWRGRAGMAEGWRAWLSAWDDFSQQVDEYRDLGDERVLVFFRCSGRGKTSGMDLGEMHPLMAAVFHLRERAVTKFVGYLDHERALEAVGLPE